MAYLFEVNGDRVVPTTEVLLMSPFKDIWERDKSEFKVQALNDFAYIEFMTSKKKTNFYKGYSEEDRAAKLGRVYYNDENHKPDELVEEAMADMIKFQTEASPTYRYYESLLVAAEKMRNFFLEVDVNERNERGALLYKPADITRAIGDIDKVLQTLNAAKEKVEQELYETTKTRGNKEIGAYED